MLKKNIYFFVKAKIIHVIIILLLTLFTQQLQATNISSPNNQQLTSANTQNPNQDLKQYNNNSNTALLEMHNTLLSLVNSNQHNFNVSTRKLTNTIENKLNNAKGGTASQISPSELSYMSRAFHSDKSGKSLSESFMKSRAKLSAQVTNLFSTPNVTYSDVLNKYESLYQDKVLKTISNPNKSVKNIDAAITNLHDTVVSNMKTFVHDQGIVTSDSLINAAQASEKERIARLSAPNGMNQYKVEAEKKLSAIHGEVGTITRNSRQAIPISSRRLTGAILNKVNTYKGPSNPDLTPSAFSYLTTSLRTDSNGETLANGFLRQSTNIQRTGLENTFKGQTTVSYKDLANKYEELYKEKAIQKNTQHDRQLRIMHDKLLNGVTDFIDKNGVITSPHLLEEAKNKETARISAISNSTMPTTRNTGIENKSNGANKTQDRWRINGRRIPSYRIKDFRKINAPARPAALPEPPKQINPAARPMARPEPPRQVNPAARPMARPETPRQVNPAARLMARPEPPRQVNSAARPAALPEPPKQVNPAARPMARPETPRQVNPAARPMARPEPPRQVNPAARPMARPEPPRQVNPAARPMALSTPERVNTLALGQNNNQVVKQTLTKSEYTTSILNKVSTLKNQLDHLEKSSSHFEGDFHQRVLRVLDTSTVNNAMSPHELSYLTKSLVEKKTGNAIETPKITQALQQYNTMHMEASTSSTSRISPDRVNQAYHTAVSEITNAVKSASEVISPESIRIKAESVVINQIRSNPNNINTESVINKKPLLTTNNQALKDYHTSSTWHTELLHEDLNKAEKKTSPDERVYFATRRLAEATKPNATLMSPSELTYFTKSITDKQNKQNLHDFMEKTYIRTNDRLRKVFHTKTNVSYKEIFNKYDELVNRKSLEKTTNYDEHIKFLHDGLVHSVLSTIPADKSKISILPEIERRNIKEDAINHLSNTTKQLVQPEAGYQVLSRDRLEKMHEDITHIANSSTPEEFTHAILNTLAAAKDPTAAKLDPVELGYIVKSSTLRADGTPLETPAIMQTLNRYEEQVKQNITRNSVPETTLRSAHNTAITEIENTIQKSGNIVSLAENRESAKVLLTNSLTNTRQNIPSIKQNTTPGLEKYESTSKWHLSRINAEFNTLSNKNPNIIKGSLLNKLSSSIQTPANRMSPSEISYISKAVTFGSRQETLMQRAANVAVPVNNKLSEIFPAKQSVTYKDILNKYENLYQRFIVDNETKYEEPVNYLHNGIAQEIMSVVSTSEINIVPSKIRNQIVAEEELHINQEHTRLNIPAEQRYREFITKNIDDLHNNLSEIAQSSNYKVIVRDGQVKPEEDTAEFTTSVKQVLENATKSEANHLSAPEMIYLAKTVQNTHNGETLERPEIVQKLQQYESLEQNKIKENTNKYDTQINNIHNDLALSMLKEVNLVGQTTSIKNNSRETVTEIKTYLKNTLGTNQLMQDQKAQEVLPQGLPKYQKTAEWKLEKLHEDFNKAARQPNLKTRHAAIVRRLSDVYTSSVAPDFVNMTNVMSPEELTYFNKSVVVEQSGQTLEKTLASHYTPIKQETIDMFEGQSAVTYQDVLNKYEELYQQDIAENSDAHSHQLTTLLQESVGGIMKTVQQVDGNFANGVVLNVLSEDVRENIKADTEQKMRNKIVYLTRETNARKNSSERVEKLHQSLTELNNVANTEEATHYLLDTLEKSKISVNEKMSPAEAKYITQVVLNKATGEPIATPALTSSIKEYEQTYKKEMIENNNPNSKLLKDTHDHLVNNISKEILKTTRSAGVGISNNSLQAAKIATNEYVSVPLGSGKLLTEQKAPLPPLTGLSQEVHIAHFKEINERRLDILENNMQKGENLYKPANKGKQLESINLDDTRRTLGSQDNAVITLGLAHIEEYPDRIHNFSELVTPTELSYFGRSIMVANSKQTLHDALRDTGHSVRDSNLSIVFPNQEHVSYEQAFNRYETIYNTGMIQNSQKYNNQLEALQRVLRSDIRTSINSQSLGRLTPIASTARAQLLSVEINRAVSAVRLSVAHLFELMEHPQIGIPNNNEFIPDMEEMVKDEALQTQPEVTHPLEEPATLIKPEARPVTHPKTQAPVILEPNPEARPITRPTPEKLVTQELKPTTLDTNALKQLKIKAAINPNSYTSTAELALAQTHKNLTDLLQTYDPHDGAIRVNVAQSILETAQKGDLNNPTTINYITKAFSKNGETLDKTFKPTTLLSGSLVKYLSYGSVSYQQIFDKYEELYNTKILTGTIEHDSALSKLHDIIINHVTDALRNRNTEISNMSLSKAHNDLSEHINMLSKQEDVYIKNRTEKLRKEQAAQESLNKLEKEIQQSPNSYSLHAAYDAEKTGQELSKLIDIHGNDVKAIQNNVLEKINNSIVDEHLSPSAVRILGNIFTSKDGESVHSQLVKQQYDVTNDLKTYFKSSKKITYEEALQKYEELYRDQLTNGVEHEAALNTLHKYLTTGLSDAIKPSILTKINISNASIDSIVKSERSDAQAFDEQQTNIEHENAKKQVEERIKLDRLATAAQIEPTSYKAHTDLALEQSYRHLREIFNTLAPDTKAMQDTVKQRLMAQNPISPIELSYISHAFSDKEKTLFDTIKTKQYNVEPAFSIYFKGSTRITFTEIMQKYEELYREQLTKDTQEHQKALVSFNNILTQAVSSSLSSSFKISSETIENTRRSEEALFIEAEKQREEYNKQQANKLESLKQKIEENPYSYRLTHDLKKEELSMEVTNVINQLGSDAKAGINHVLKKLNNIGDSLIHPTEIHYIGNAVMIDDHTLLEQGSNDSSYLPDDSNAREVFEKSPVEYSEIINQYEKLYENKISQGTTRYDDLLKALSNIIVEHLKAPIEKNIYGIPEVSDETLKTALSATDPIQREEQKAKIEQDNKATAKRIEERLQANQNVLEKNPQSYTALAKYQIEKTRLELSELMTEYGPKSKSVTDSVMTKLQQKKTKNEFIVPAEARYLLSAFDVKNEAFSMRPSNTTLDKKDIESIFPNHVQVTAEDVLMKYEELYKEKIQKSTTEHDRTLEKLNNVLNKTLQKTIQDKTITSSKMLNNAKNDADPNTTSDELDELKQKLEQDKIEADKTTNKLLEKYNAEPKSYGALSKYELEKTHQKTAEAITRYGNNTSAIANVSLHHLSTEQPHSPSSLRYISQAFSIDGEPILMFKDEHEEQTGDGELKTDFNEKLSQYEKYYKEYMIDGNKEHTQEMTQLSKELSNHLTMALNSNNIQISNISSGLAKMNAQSTITNFEKEEKQQKEEEERQRKEAQKRAAQEAEERKKAAEKLAKEEAELQKHIEEEKAKLLEKEKVQKALQEQATRRTEAKNQVTDLTEKVRSNPNSYEMTANLDLAKAHVSLLQILEQSNNGTASIKEGVINKLNNALAGEKISPAEIHYLTNAVSVNRGNLSGQLLDKTFTLGTQLSKHFPNKSRVTYEEALNKYEELYREQVITGNGDSQAIKMLHDNIVNMMKQSVDTFTAFVTTSEENILKSQLEETERIPQYEAQRRDITQKREMAEKQLNNLKQQYEKDGLYTSYAQYELERVHQEMTELLRTHGNDHKAMKSTILDNLHNAASNKTIMSPTEINYLTQTLEVDKKPISERVRDQQLTLDSETAKHFAPLVEKNKVSFTNILQKYNELYQEKLEKKTNTHDKALLKMHNFLIAEISNSIPSNYNPINEFKILPESAEFAKGHELSRIAQMRDNKPENNTSTNEEPKPSNDAQNTQAEHTKPNENATPLVDANSLISKAQADKVIINSPLNASTINGYKGKSQYLLMHEHSTLYDIMRSNPEQAAGHLLNTFNTAMASYGVITPSELNYYANILENNSATNAANFLKTNLLEIDAELKKYCNDNNITTHEDAIKQYEELYHAQAYGENIDPKILKGLHNLILHGMSNHIKTIGNVKLEPSTMQKLWKDEKIHIEESVEHLTEHYVPNRSMYENHENISAIHNIVATHNNKTALAKVSTVEAH